MADNTAIEWTEATWNPITGCTVHSAGCTNCYAMKLAGTRLQHHPSRAGLTKPSKAGPVWNGQVRFNEEWLTQPLNWKRPRMIFVCAHGDLFHKDVPDEWIDRIFAVMALCPHHTFQVLTKRSARMREYMTFLPDSIEDIAIAAGQLMDDGDGSYSTVLQIMNDPLPNVWLGVSVENQAAADERIPDLLNTPAAIRWISAEPLLGPLKIHKFQGMVIRQLYSQKSEVLPFLDWVVAGGESGKPARPMHPDWARSLRDQCAAACTPFFFKQWGEWCELDHVNVCPETCGLTTHKFSPTEIMARCGKKAAGRLLDGVQHDGMPTAK